MSMSNTSGQIFENKEARIVELEAQIVELEAQIAELEDHKRSDDETITRLHAINRFHERIGHQKEPREQEVESDVEENARWRWS